MHFITYITVLRADNNEVFFIFSYITKHDELYNKLKPKITRQDTNMRSTIIPHIHIIPR